MQELRKHNDNLIAIVKKYEETKLEKYKTLVQQYYSLVEQVSKRIYNSEINENF